MGIAHRRLNVSVTQDFFDFIEVQAVLNQTGCVGMPQSVGCATSDASPLESLLERQIDIVPSQALLVVVHELVLWIDTSTAQDVKNTVCHIQN